MLLRYSRIASCSHPYHYGPLLTTTVQPREYCVSYYVCSLYFCEWYSSDINRQLQGRCFDFSDHTGDKHERCPPQCFLSSNPFTRFLNVYKEMAYSRHSTRGCGPITQSADVLPRLLDSIFRLRRKYNLVVCISSFRPTFSACLLGYAYTLDVHLLLAVCPRSGRRQDSKNAYLKPAMRSHSDAQFVCSPWSFLCRRLHCASALSLFSRKSLSNDSTFVSHIQGLRII